MDIANISGPQAKSLIERSEGHVLDNKAIEIRPARRTKTLSTAANADGGQLIIGLDESSEAVQWRGPANAEDANGHLRHLDERFPYSGDFVSIFLTCETRNGVILRVAIMKTHDLRKASDDRWYVRRRPQNLPVQSEIARVCSGGRRA